MDNPEFTSKPIDHEPETHVSTASILADFGKSAVQSGVISPLWNGLGGLLSNGKLEQVSITNSENAKNSKIDDWSQKLGGAVGMAADFVLLSKAKNKVFGDALSGEKAQSLSLGHRSLLQAAEGTKLGAVYGAVFTPSSQNENISQLLAGRAKNAITDGLTFGALSGTAQGLGGLKAFDKLGPHSWQSKVKDIGVAGLSGFPAGAVGAETDSLINRQQFATWKDVKAQAGEFGAIGFALGGMPHAINAFKPGKPGQIGAGLSDLMPEHLGVPLGKLPVQEFTTKGDHAEPRITDSTTRKNDTKDSRVLFSDKAIAQDFVDRVTPQLRSWQDSDVAAQFKQHEAALARREKLTEGSNMLVSMFMRDGALQRQYGQNHFPEDVFVNRQEMLPWLRNNKDARRQYDQYWSRRREIDSNTGSLDEVFSSRKDELQTAVNASLKENRLAPVSIEIRHDMGQNAGAYQPGKGVLSLPGRIFAGTEHPAETTGTIAHELTHLKQDQEILRLRLDQLDIGKTANTSERRKFTESYKDDFGIEPNQRHIDNILDMRDGRRLSEDESTRARQLDAEQRMVAENGVLKVNRLSERVTQLAQIDNAVNTSSALDVVKSLNDQRSGTLNADSLKNKNGFPAGIARLMQQQKQIAAGELPASSWNEAQAQTMLKTIVPVACRAAVTAMHEAETTYRSNLLEEEAFAVEPLINQLAEQALKKD